MVMFFFEKKLFDGGCRECQVCPTGEFWWSKEEEFKFIFGDDDAVQFDNQNV